MKIIWVKKKIPMNKTKQDQQKKLKFQNNTHKTPPKKKKFGSRTMLQINVFK